MTIVKYEFLSKESKKDVLLRCQKLKSRAIFGVPRLIHFGILSHPYCSKSFLLRIEHERALGAPLQTLTVRERKELKKPLKEIFQKTLIEWKKAEFIHGDLSLRNILIFPEVKPRVTFIDWLINIHGFSGTPLFTAPEVLKGRPRTFESDCFALNKILVSL